MKQRVLNECQNCEIRKDMHDGKYCIKFDSENNIYRTGTTFKPVVVFELSEAEIKLLEAKV
jgi:hypothetical protein